MSKKIHSGLPLPIYSSYRIYENISDAKLGSIVREAHEKHLEKIKELTPQWIITGKKFKQARKKLNISRKELSKYIGISEQVIAKFEKGQSVRSRNMLQQSYQTAMDLIQIQRNTFINHEMEELNKYFN